MELFALNALCLIMLRTVVYVYADFRTVCNAVLVESPVILVPYRFLLVLRLRDVRPLLLSNTHVV